MFRHLLICGFHWNELFVGMRKSMLPALVLYQSSQVKIIVQEKGNK